MSSATPTAVAPSSASQSVTSAAITIPGIAPDSGYRLGRHPGTPGLPASGTGPAGFGSGPISGQSMAGSVPGSFSASLNTQAAPPQAQVPYSAYQVTPTPQTRYLSQLSWASTQASKCRCLRRSRLTVPKFQPRLTQQLRLQCRQCRQASTRTR